MNTGDHFRTVLFIALLSIAPHLTAQSDTPLAGDTTSYRIVLDDRTLLIGVIEGSEGGTMMIRTGAMGLVHVPISRIVRMERMGIARTGPDDDLIEPPAPVPPESRTPPARVLNPRHPRSLRPPLPPVRVTVAREVRDPAERWFRERHAGRYFLSPAAFPLKAGEGYYRNTFFLLQTGTVGVTDHIAISGGFELLSVLGLSRQAPGFHLGAKAAWKLHRVVHLGVSAAFANTPMEYEGPFERFHDNEVTHRQGVAAAHGLLTIGTDRYHGTLGGGIRFHEWDGLEETPTFSLGMAARVLPKLWVISDNWFVGEDGETTPWWSLGVRFASRSVAVDFALVNTEKWQDEVYFGIPFVSCCINFGHRKKKSL